MMKTKQQRSSNVEKSLAAIDRDIGPILYLPIKDIKSYERELRKHPEKQLVKLMASISRFGFILPMLVDEDGTLIAGEARFKAAVRLGLKEVPVLVATHLSSGQVKAYRLADNRLSEHSSWNEDALAIELCEILEIDEAPIELLGWDTAEIDVMLSNDDIHNGSALDPADAQMAATENPVSRNDDLWELDKHRLLCGSSLNSFNWDRLLSGELARMAFVDPPYNVPVNGHICGLGKIKHAEFAMASGEMSQSEQVEFNTDWIQNLCLNLVDGAITFICMDWRHMDELQRALETNKLSLINLCVWNKNNGGMGSLYRSKHELIFVAKKGNAPHVNNVELGKHGRYRTNVWDFAGVNSFGANRLDDLSSHPTIKPVSLVAEAIRDVSRPGEIVLDAFVGSGTTILAAERTRRRACAIEIEPAYVDVAIERWQKLTGKDAVLTSTGQAFAEVAAERLSTIQGNASA